MTYKENIKAILQCWFTGFKEEIIEGATDRILEQTCHTCKHYTSGEHDGSCGSYICKGYSNWESEGMNEDTNRNIK